MYLLLLQLYAAFTECTMFDWNTVIQEHQYCHNNSCTYIIACLYLFYKETLLAKQWRSAENPGQSISARCFHVPHTSATFNAYYNGVQDSLKAIAGMDELLEGAQMHPSIHVHIYTQII